jgi:DmsE family decaheme c-type cytochrome
MAERTGTNLAAWLIPFGLLVCSVAVISEAQGAASAAPQQSRRIYQSPQGSQPVGKERCLDCHDEKKQTLLKVHANCESCHGPGSVHVESPSSETIAYPDATACLTCHQYNDARRLTWKWSEHRQANLACMDCHSAHKESFRKPDVRFPYLDPKSALCMQCHANKVGQFRMTSHHPVLEGGMNCVDCHNPHEDRKLQATATNDLCFRCHQEKRGPWVYEHQPAAEDCTLCHNPHGSVSTRLLRKNQPYLCLTCHSIASNRHVDQGSTGIPGTNFTRIFFSRCTDCHGAVHGTHQDEWLRR